MNEVTVTSLKNLQNEVTYGDGRTFVIDEPASVGGEGAGPDPYSLILAALGGCTSMTVMMYARRKEWKLERVSVKLSQQRIHAKDCHDCDTETDGFIQRIERKVTLEGDLSEEQRKRLMEISRLCPVHKMLTSHIVIKDA
ncbi:MAG: OsmC family protein [Pyrinomonadaceae bacterium]